MVTGVLIFARTSKASARLSEQFRLHQVEKKYLALVAPPPSSPTATLENWLRHNDAAHRVETTPPLATNARQAILKYQRLEIRHGIALLRINLLTGRKHQIRVQLAAAGHPILGDNRYGSRHPFPRGIALHSESLAIQHPTTHQTLHFQAPLPDTWPNWAVAPENQVG